jgi:hypothetical protein
MNVVVRECVDRIHGLGNEIPVVGHGWISVDRS